MTPELLTERQRTRTKEMRKRLEKREVESKAAQGSSGGRETYTLSIGEVSEPRSGAEHHSLKTRGEHELNFN